MPLWGCVIEFEGKKTYLKIANQYHQPINEITILEITAEGSITYYNYFTNLNITEGNSKTFELDVSTNPFEADIKVSFDSKYDIKAIRFAEGRTTTVVLDENGILK